jgi:hypothetical protein
VIRSFLPSSSFNNKIMSAPAESPASAKRKELEHQIDLINQKVAAMAINGTDEDYPKINTLTSVVKGLQTQLSMLLKSAIESEVAVSAAYVPKIRATAINFSDLASNPHLQFNFADPTFEYLRWWEAFQDACAAHSITPQESIQQIMHCMVGDTGGQSLLRGYLQENHEPPTTWAEVDAIIKGIFKSTGELLDLTMDRFEADKLTSLSQFVPFFRLYRQRMKTFKVEDSEYFVEQFLRRLQGTGLRKKIDDDYNLCKKIAQSHGRQPPAKDFDYILKVGVEQIHIMQKEKSARQPASAQLVSPARPNPKPSAANDATIKRNVEPSVSSVTPRAAPPAAEATSVKAASGMECSFCKPDPGNHSTNRCLSKNYYDRQIKAGKNAKDIVIPPLDQLQEESKQRTLRKLASGGIDPANIIAKGRHDHASMAQFANNTDEDSDYSRVSAPRKPIKKRASIVAVTDESPLITVAAAKAESESAAIEHVLQTSIAVSQPALPKVSRSLKDDLEARLIPDGDGAYDLKPIEIPSLQIGKPAQDRYPTTSIAVDEFSKFAVHRLDFSKAYAPASAVTAIEIVHEPSARIWQLTAPVDSECSRSLIFSWFADMMGIEYKQSQHQVKDFRGIACNAAFATSPVILRHGTLQAKIDKLMVITADKPAAPEASCPMLLGSDLVSLGFRVTGVQAIHSAQLIELRKFDSQIYPAAKRPSPVPELHMGEADQAARAQLMALLIENNQLCPEGSMCKLPNATYTVRLIPGGEEKLKHQAQYRLSAEKQAVMDKTLQKLLDLGIIGRNTDPDVKFSQPHVVASQTQADGSIKNRLCFAAMALNKVTVPDSRTVPLTHLQLTSEYRHLSTLDVADFYTHFPVAAESQRFLTFVWRGQFFQYRRCIYGLLNSMSHSQTILESALAGVVTKPSLVEAYVDDVRSADKTLPKHVEQMSIVIRMLTSAGFRIKIAKCVLNGIQVLSAGYLIGPGYSMAEASKLSYIREFVAPRQTKKVDSFLCFLQYLSKFVLKFADLVAPLHDAVLAHKKRNDKDFAWTDDLHQNFDQIKKVFASIPRLNAFNPDLVTHVVWDASTRAWGAVLYQYEAGSTITTPTTDNIVAMSSKRFNTAETAGGSYKLEVQAGIRSMLAFHDLLIGRKFIASTDNIAIIWLFSNVKPNRFSLNMMHALSAYCFDIEHLPGPRMVAQTPCDFLTRAWTHDNDGALRNDAPLGDGDFPVSDFVSQLSLDMEPPANRDPSAVVVSRDSDSAQRVSTRSSQSADAPISVEVEPTLPPPVPPTAVVPYTPEPVPDIDPHALRTPDSPEHATALIDAAHAFGHWGERSMRRRLILEGWQMREHSNLIDRTAQNCSICQQWTRAQTRYARFRSTQPSKPCDVISFDLATGFLPNERGFTAMLIVVCNLTKYVWIRPLRQKTAAAIGPALFDIFVNFGFAAEIGCDHEPVLMAVVKVLKDELRMQYRQTVEYAPRTNSNAETAVKLASTMVHKLSPALARTGISSLRYAKS